MTRNDEVPQEVGEAIRTQVEAERALVLAEARVGPYYAGARLLHDEMLAQETARDALETVIRDHIRAKLDAAEGEVARLREDAEIWKPAFIHERARLYRAEGMKIEQARIHAEADVATLVSIAQKGNANA